MSKYIDEPFALPSQIDISAGVVQTTNSVTPSISFPLSSTFTQAVASATTRTTTIAGSGFGLGASDTWQQNWTVSPVTDANALRNLRALYRSVIYGTDVLKNEYHVPREYNSRNELISIPYELEEPHCVICGKDNIPNKNLQGGWLYWESDNSDATQPHMPLTTGEMKNLGHFGNHTLFMKHSDYLNGALAEFTLFVLPNAIPADNQKSGGADANPKGASTPRSSVGRNNFDLKVAPPAILSPP